MRNKQTCLHLMASRAAIQGQFRTGICLHGHTHHSRESLAFISRILEFPIAAALTKSALARYERTHGERLDFNRAFWTPPLPPGQAYELECEQIEEALELDALVSLTDHDSIEAGVSLESAGRDIPISIEWTVPYPPTYLHIGVHNLPPRSAREWAARLLGYTQKPSEALLEELLAGLDRTPSVLLVLNHPLWEMEPLGADRVTAMVQSFLRRHGGRIHAVEINGLRGWTENQRVLNMARELGYPLVSGGDRHGWEPSAMLNLTRAQTFSEFVEEVRKDGLSEVVMMDQYEAPFNYRMLQVVWDVFREYPAYPAGKKVWTDRVFFELPGNPLRPLSSCWSREEPRELKQVARMMRALEAPPFQAALRLLFADGQRSLT